MSLNGHVANIAELANQREKAKTLVRSWVGFLKANELSAGHVALFPEPSTDQLCLTIGCVSEALTEAGWFIRSHSSAVVGMTGNTEHKIPVLFLSLLIERKEGKQLVHLG